MNALRGEAHVRCDGCNRSLSVPNVFASEDFVLPPGWREVHIDGWAGSFHACRDKCELDVRTRIKNSVPPPKPDD